MVCTDHRLQCLTPHITRHKFPMYATQSVQTHDFRVSAFQLISGVFDACMGNLWFVLVIDCNVKHHIIITRHKFHIFIRNTECAKST